VSLIDNISIETESQKHIRQMSSTTDLLEYTPSYQPENSEEFNFKLLRDDEYNLIHASKVTQPFNHAVKKSETF
jgi:hypothetical protein